MWMVVMAAAAVLQAGPPTEAQFIAARAALDAKMLDYTSARFRDVRADSRRICGYVNAKNRLGAYTGWSRFVVMGAGSVTRFEDDDSTGFVAMMCDEDGPKGDTDYSARITYRPPAA